MKSAAHGASRVGALALGALALGCAGAFAYIASNMMSSSYAKTKVTPIVVAEVQLRVGDAIQEGDLTVVDWPVESVPQGAFTDVKTLLASYDNVTPTVGILAGEPVVKSRLSSADQGTGVAALVSPSMRAVALEVDASVANTGLVYPGAHVDVIVTFRDRDGHGPLAYTAVQRAQVLSVGLDVDVATRSARTDDDDRRHRDTTYVTLQVTPEEAEIIGVARSEGRIDLSLRNGGDSAIVETPGANPETLMPKLAMEEDGEGDGEAPSEGDKAEPRKHQRRASRYRSPRLRLTAKDDVPTRRSSRSGIETYRAN